MTYKDILLYTDRLIAIIGSSVIVYSALKAGALFLKGLFFEHLDINKLRCDLGYGIILGLEFMIGADIIKSMAQPTYHDLGILAILVAVRTFLSYVLAKEMEALKLSS